MNHFSIDPFVIVAFNVSARLGHGMESPKLSAVLIPEGLLRLGAQKMVSFCLPSWLLLRYLYMSCVYSDRWHELGTYLHHAGQLNALI